MLTVPPAPPVSSAERSRFDSGIIVGSYAFTEGGAQKWAVQFDDNNAVIRLPPLSDYTLCEARAVASDGTSAGLCSGADFGPTGTAPVFWDPARAVHGFMPVDPGVQPEVMDINDNGVVVGLSYANAVDRRMFSWAYDTRTETLLELATPSEATYARPSAINDRGEVVGTLFVENPTAGRSWFPIQWSADGQTVFRLALPPDCFGTALGINNLGVIVGTTACRNPEQAVIWSSRDALPQALIPPQGYAPVITFATDVNDAGRVIGLGQRIGWGGTIETFGFGWTEQRQPVAFGNAVPEAINESGATVGRRGSAAVIVDW